MGVGEKEGGEDQGEKTFTTLSPDSPIYEMREGDNRVDMRSIITSEPNLKEGGPAKVARRDRVDF